MKWNYELSIQHDRRGHICRVKPRPPWYAVYTADGRLACEYTEERLIELVDIGTWIIVPKEIPDDINTLNIGD